MILIKKLESVLKAQFREKMTFLLFYLARHTRKTTRSHVSLKNPVDGVRRKKLSKVPNPILKVTCKCNERIFC